MFHLGLLCLIVTSPMTLIESLEDIAQDNRDTLCPHFVHFGLPPRYKETEVCRTFKNGNMTHSIHRAHENNSDNLPVIQSRQLIKQVGSPLEKRFMFFLQQIVNNPLSTLSILEAGYPGSCMNKSGAKGTVRDTARRKNCVFASNAGFFNSRNGHCRGNVVSDGERVSNARGVQNAHFGITTDNKIFTGYLSESDYLSHRFNFKQLVGGVIWLVKDGQSYVNESMKVECPIPQEAGNITRFVHIRSGRTALGHDRYGRVQIVQVSGWTQHMGVNLYEFSEVLISMGIVNAINLDGGGSTTSIINNTLANFPGNKCPGTDYTCEREVSTVICVHPPECSPPDCSKHGVCENGRCQCREPWMGDGCELWNHMKCGPQGTWVEGGYCLAKQDPRLERVDDMKEEVGTGIYIVAYGCVLAVASYVLNILFSGLFVNSQNNPNYEKMGPKIDS